MARPAMPETSTQAYSQAATATDNESRTTIIGSRLWMGGQFALCALWSALFVVAFNFAVTVSFYLVSGVWSWSLFSAGAEAYPTDAVSRLATSSDVRFGGDPGFLIRTVAALLICTIPVITRAISAGSYYLLDGSLFTVEGLPHLLLRWAGVIAGASIAGLLLGVL